MAAMDRHWQTALKDFSSWIKKATNEQQPDLVVNITASLSGRLVGHALRARDCRGFCLDPAGFGIYSSPWAAFLQASSQQRGCSPFNLVDLFTKVGHLDPGQESYTLKPPAIDRLEGMRRLLEKESPPNSKGFVGFQLGASEERRRWPAESFARLGRLIWDNFSLTPVLLGSAAETPIETLYQQETSTPAISLIGRTDLADLAAVLPTCKLLITNDTGTMHLAAGLRIPVLAFFLATAQPWDTGPYLENCLCLEPDCSCHPCSFGSVCVQNEICRTTIAPESVFQFLEPFLINGHWPQKVESRQSSLRAWVTHRDEFGFMDLWSPTGHDASPRAQWVALQRYFYRQFLDRRPFSRSSLPLDLDKETRLKILETLEQSQDLLFLLLQLGQALLAQPKLMEKKFLATWQRLISLWEDSSHFAVLGQLWLYQTQDAGRDVPQMLTVVAHYQLLISTWIDALNSPD